MKKEEAVRKSKSLKKTSRNHLTEKTSHLRKIVAGLLLGGLLTFGQLTGQSATVKAAEIPADSLNSIMWTQMAKMYLLTGGHEDSSIVMDDSILVHAPKSAEDQLNIPVYVDARAVKDVRKIIVIADLNPLPKVLTFEPEDAEARLSFRIKVEQGTPVRAAVLDAKGVWHVAGTYVDAAGGGCSQPAMAHGKPDWVQTLAEVRGKIWRKPGESVATMRLSVRHPMDTGLADGIPAFYVEKLEFSSKRGEQLGSITMHEPVSENPTLTLYPKLKDSTQAVNVKGRDNEGNLIDLSIPAPVHASHLNLKD